MCLAWSILNHTQREILSPGLTDLKHLPLAKDILAHGGTDELVH